MINVLIIEDDAVIQSAVEEFLNQQSIMNVVGNFYSIEEFKLALPLGKNPHVVLLDIVLPGISGIQGLHHIRNVFPNAGVIMFSVMDDGHSIFQSLCEGAVGYLSKEFTLESLSSAIIDVFEGRGSMSPSIARKVAEHFHPKKKLSEELTNREVDIVNGIIDGLSYKMLASRYEISIDTARKHIKNIYRKLQVNSKAQLISQYFIR